MASKERNTPLMTQGNPMRQILTFSLPLLAGNFLQQMYNMVDSMVVGQFVGTTVLAAVGAIPLSIIGMLCVDPIAALLQVPNEVLPELRTYLLVILGGLIGMFGYNANSGILQGLGGRRSPLLFLIIASVINIVLDLVFVLVFGLGAS